MFDVPRRQVLEALGIGGASTVLGAGTSVADGSDRQRAIQQADDLPRVDRIAADPTEIPGPIERDEPTEHEITLTAEEVVAEIEPGVEFPYLTFDGQIPGPMIRVREGDTINLTFENPERNKLPHNVDLHAVYGTGGGAVGTDALPGESNSIRFQARYPGAYIYHCAVQNLDYHISSGMFGMIVVEPEGGLPEADRELYFSQHEIYTDAAVGEEGRHGFSFDAMQDEEPTYVVLNGESAPFTPDRYGSVKAERDETVRVFFVTGGPNVSSNLHPIGNVWERAWRDGAPGAPEEYVQTMKVPPGSCMMGTMETPVPERITLVDHALSRMTSRGMVGYIDVEGEERPEIYDPNPNGEDGNTTGGNGGGGTAQHEHNYDAVGGMPPMMEALENRLFERTLRWPGFDEADGGSGIVPPISGDSENEN